MTISNPRFGKTAATNEKLVKDLKFKLASMEKSQGNLQMLQELKSLRARFAAAEQELRLARIDISQLRKRNEELTIAALPPPSAT